jgi:hypothetical protein
VDRAAKDVLIVDDVEFDFAHFEDHAFRSFDVAFSPEGFRKARARRKGRFFS